MWLHLLEINSSSVRTSVFVSLHHVQYSTQTLCITGKLQHALSGCGDTQHSSTLSQVPESIWQSQLHEVIFRHLCSE